MTAAPETAQSSLQATKRRVQRQLADARALLTARTGQVTQVALPSASLPAIESRPAEAAWTPPVQETLPAADPLWQQPTAATGTPFTTSTPRPMDATPATGIPLTADSSLATNAPLTADPYLPTYTSLPMDATPAHGTPLTAATPPATNTPLTTDPYLPTYTSLPMDATPAHGTPLTADPYLTTNTPLADASFTMSTPVATDALATAQAPYAATPPYAPNAQFRADATSGTGLPLATPAPAGIASAPSPVGIAPAPEASAADTKAHRASAFARAQIGKPCVWGAAGPGSYDAAGLVQAAWKAADVALPRTAPAQAAAGTVVSLADARVGDLIFFYDDLSHVGLYVGNGTMIHAPGPGAYIREESVFHAGESAIRGAVRPA
ncbi:C40 family peptidase [Streptomyces resistomycificus]|uniref:C40 family peptidase n=1 Tax=Streptomyces resistomycificus TaxID=67356 RepID=UPI00384EB0E1